MMDSRKLRILALVIGALFASSFSIYFIMRAVDTYNDHYKTVCTYTEKCSSGVCELSTERLTKCVYDVNCDKGSWIDVVEYKPTFSCANSTRDMFIHMPAVSLCEPNLVITYSVVVIMFAAIAAALVVLFVYCVLRDARQFCA